jgi:hypothetical protein
MRRFVNNKREGGFVDFRKPDAKKPDPRKL